MGKTTKSVIHLDKAAVLKVLDECEGHTIFDPELVVEAGLDPEFVKTVTFKHKSDGTPKGTIFGSDGNIRKEMTGVYDLNLVHALCTYYGVDSRTPYFGRGTECRELVKRLREYLENRKD